MRGWGWSSKVYKKQGALGGRVQPRLLGGRGGGERANGGEEREDGVGGGGERGQTVLHGGEDKRN